jgi:outer membrane protein OmpA-like peptidoglycan-associated protein/tetratricopeptide (TPR) repeat protein
MSKVFLVLLLFFLAFAASAQSYSVADGRAIRLFEEGEQLLTTKRYAEALLKFQAALDRQEDFFEAYQRAAQVLISQGKLQEAEALALRGKQGTEANVGKVKKNYSVDFGWLLTTIYLKQGHFGEAHQQFLALESLFDEGFKKSPHYLQMKAQMDFLAVQLDRKRAITKEVLPEPLNRFALQYFPVLTADGKQLFFTRRGGTAHFDKEDIYLAYADDSAGWSSPESISSRINSPYNEGTCSVTADGNFLIFTSCDAPDTKGSCDLYSAEKINGEWQAPRNMGPKVNSSFWDSQPSLSADGRLLFFSSDRRGGLGGNDLWYATRRADGTWSEAVNLGAPINTAKDEISPFLFFNNEILFFASDGHLGFGGMDIFLSKVDGSKFEQPENLGLPINDQLDQVALFITAEKEYAYYSEHTVTNGAADRAFLYRFKFPEDIPIGQNLTVTQGKVLNARTGLPLSSSLSLVSLANDSTVYEFQSDGKSGAFVMLYPEESVSGLYVEKQGFLPKIYDVGRDSIKNVKDLKVSLVPIAAGEEFVFENVFFDFNSDELKPESVSSLRRLHRFLLVNPKVQILISGHTDNIGTAAYNRALSLRRAQSVQAYLVQAGIVGERLGVEGKGDGEPMLPNSSAENQARNRRITVKVR